MRGGKEQSKCAGYQVKHMVESYFLMHQDLKNNTNKQWAKKKYLDNFVQWKKEYLSPSEQIEQKNKVDKRFVTSLKMLNNIFCLHDLHSKLFLDTDNGEQTNVTYNYEFHSSKINIDSVPQIYQRKMHIHSRDQEFRSPDKTFTRSFKAYFQW